jgi:crotonyl-CoA carboxylase/reductase
MSTLALGHVPDEVGEVPSQMLAVTIRKDREGEPSSALRVEEVPLPEIGAREVLVLVMAAGVNFNGIWAARGAPISVFRRTREPFHIPGSDASGIVWKVGSEVTRWRPGQHVVMHCNQSCGECAECNGLDPMACEQQRIWGYETNWGSFAQFTKVQAQQLLPKPAHLSWEEAASYGLTFFTAYRMLITQARMAPGDHVLIWGAAGGLGIFAVQLCAMVGANPIAVVGGGAEKEALVRAHGATAVIDRSRFDLSAGVTASRAFGAEIRRLTGGVDPDIVFEHVGRETFATSVLVAKRFGKIVICGATSGHDLQFDVRHLWMRQKQILGSHFANAYQAERANRLVHEKKIRPVVWRSFSLDETAHAHQLMANNLHQGKLTISIQSGAHRPAASSVTLPPTKIGVEHVHPL